MQLVEQLNYDLNIKQLLEECPDILCIHNHPLGFRMNGLSVQHRKGIVEPWTSIDGLESLKLYGDVSEAEFNVVNKSYKNTLIEKVIQDFKLVRSRFLVLPGRINYSIHQDNTWRLHIPIKTNPDCLFYFPDHKEHFHLEEGKVYKVNTTERHTFLNAGICNRVHFIGCL